MPKFALLFVMLEKRCIVMPATFAQPIFGQQPGAAHSGAKQRAMRHVARTS